MNRIAQIGSTMAALLFGAAGCSIAPKPTTVQLLDPRPQPTVSTTGSPAPWSLGVARPEADPTRDSNRVLVRTTDGRLQVHPSARWIAPAPDLFRTLLVRHTRDRELLAGIDTTVTSAARLLMIDLRRFELAESGGGSLSAEIGIEARLYDGQSSEPLARRTFEARRQLGSSRPAVINEGFEQALADMLTQIGDWVIGVGEP